MLGNLRNDYVSLNLPSSLLNNNQGWLPKRSLWRSWNQLSRFQRSVIYLFLLVIILMAIYFLSGEAQSANETLGLPSQKVHALEMTQAHPSSHHKGEPHEDEANTPSRSNINLPDENKIPGNVDHAKEENIPAIGGGDEASHKLGQIGSPHKKGVQFFGPTTERQIAVVEALKHAWQGYKKFAWGHDHLKPISATYQDWFTLGLTIVDAMDTILIMGLQTEFAEAQEWVATNLNFDVNKDVNLFEVTIRVLGSLLSTYHLSGDKMFLDKAVDLGQRLLPCFDSESGVPYSDVNLKTRKAHSPKWSPDSSTSEVTTIQLEFRDLSRASGDPRFEEAAARVSLHIHGLEKTEGLVPIFINANTGKFRSYSTITLGARGDSYYEYLLKQWLQTGKTIDFLRDDFLEAIAGVQNLLVKRTPRHKHLFLGELVAGGRDFKPKMDHLSCYLPGTLALGVHNGLPREHMQLAEDLLETCYQTYAQQPTFLAPEITYFNIQEGNKDDLYVKTNDAHNLLRPEFIESLWYMYQLTGNTTYQDWGWQIFQAFEKYTRVTNGYTSIGNVRNVLNLRPRDMMESFFLGETLKYLYLLFSDERKLISLDRFVFNSEAHPLPIYDT